MNTTNDRTVSELQMRALIQAIPDLVWLKDTKGVYLLCNSRFEDFFGAREGAIVGKTDYDFVDKDMADFFRRNDQIAMDCGGPSSNEEWITFASDGHRELTLTTKTPVCDSMGKVIGVLGIGHNITERHRNELAMAESEARFRTVFELSQDAIVIHQNGKLLHINPATVQLFGAKNAQELLDKPILELIHPDYQKIVLDRIKAANSQGIGGPRIEEKYIKLDGTVIDVEAQGQPIGLSGQPTVMVTLRDITERKHAEEVLKRNEAYTRSILDSISDQIAVIDQNGVITAVNAVWSSFSLENSPLHGRPADHTGVGANYLETCRASAASGLSSAESAADGIQAVLDGRLTTFSLEFPCHSPEKQRWFRMRVTPLSSESGVAVIAHTDITEQVLAKNALVESRRLLQEKEERLALAVLHNGIGIWDWNLQTLEMVWDDSMFALYRMRREDFSGAVDAWEKSLHPDDRTHAERVVQKALAGVEPFDSEFRICWPNEEIRYIKAVAKVFRDEAGKPLRMLGTNIDITERKRVEMELRASEERLSFVVRGTNDGTWDWNLVCNELYYSPRWWNMIGYTEGELTNDADLWRRLLHPDDLERVNRIFGAALEGSADTYDVEFRLLHKDGHYLPVLSRGFILRDETGKALRVCGANTDIAERKQAAAALQMSEARFRNLLQDVPSVAVQGYGEDGTTHYWNQASERLYGFSAAEAVGRSLLDTIIPTEMHDGVSQAMRGMFESGIPIPAGELSLRRKDGSRVDVFSSHAYVQVPGQPPEMFCVDIDLTERKRIEFELMESEKKFRLIAENTSDCITIFDRNRTIQYVSPSVVTQLGYSESEELGRSDADVYEMLHPDGRDALFQKFDEAIRNKALTLMCSYRIKHKAGHYIWREDSINFRYTSSGEYDGAYVVSRNITERKRMEEEARHLAYFDSLTQLPNRRMLSDRLGQAIAASKRNSLYASVLILDLDNFKSLNDQHGHLVGDLLLVEVAHRLTACVREVDTVARFGGDEFVVVLHDLGEDEAESQKGAQAVAEKIRLALEVPYLLRFKKGDQTPKTIEHPCSASIGVALFLNHEADPSDLLKWADAAMYQAKAAGRNTIRFYGAPD